MDLIAAHVSAHRPGRCHIPPLLHHMQQRGTLGCGLVDLYGFHRKLL